MRDRLINLIKEFNRQPEKNCPQITDGVRCEDCEYNIDGVSCMDIRRAEYLLENGVIAPPCKVGDTVYYVSENPINLSVQANTIYEADITRIITTRYGTTLVIQIHNSYGCTEIPDINDFGKTVFLTKEEAEQALNNVENGNS